MEKDYKIIDNAVPELLFKKLQGFFSSNEIGWFWSAASAHNSEEPGDYDYSFANWILSPQGQRHDPAFTLCYTTFYAMMSGHYENDLEITRVRAGMETAQPETKIAPPHVDSHLPHMVALLYLNDSDGPTYLHNKRAILGEGEESVEDVSLKDLDLKKSIKVDCKENRLIIFNGNQYHSSTKQSTPARRMALNYNFNEIIELT